MISGKNILKKAIENKQLSKDIRRNIKLLYLYL